MSVDPNLPVILDLDRSFVAVVSTEDYHVMGERLFNALYELNISKILLFPSSTDNESSLALIANRFQFMGYEVMTQTEPTGKYRTSAAYDSIAAAICIFRTYSVRLFPSLN